MKKGKMIQGQKNIIDRKSISELVKRGVSLRFYVASKTKHAPMWRELRALGIPIISTWIDEAGEGQTRDYSELAVRCVREISEADAILLYCEPGEILKGAQAEYGIGLPLGKEIRCVGDSETICRVFRKHPLWTDFPSLEAAIAAFKSTKNHVFSEAK